MTILTIKLPDSLAQDLGLESEALNMAKGAVVREALANYLKTKKSTLADQVKTATLDMLKGKKRKKISINWQSLREKCRIDSGLTPEEEVRLSRNRGLLT